MDEKIIIKNNELIAKFMGGRFTFIKPHTPNVEFKVHPRGDRNFNSSSFHPRHLSYHKSWDWLMPVVEKVESLDCNVGIFTGMKNDSWCRIVRFGKFGLGDKEIGIKDNSRIISVFKAIIEFIKWYNKIK
jgi:hypothetical protein